MRLRFNSYEKLNALLLDKTDAYAISHRTVYQPERTIWESPEPLLTARPSVQGHALAAMPVFIACLRSSSFCRRAACRASSNDPCRQYGLFREISRIGSAS